MIGWSLKSCSYRLACCGIVLGFLQFVVGFGLPAWKRDERVISGLWQNCTASLSQCESYSTHSGEGMYLKAYSWPFSVADQHRHQMVEMFACVFVVLINTSGCCYPIIFMDTMPHHMAVPILTNTKLYHV